MARSRPTEWVLKVETRNGPEHFYGTNFWGGDFTAAPGDAHRYEPEMAATYVEYTLKDKE